MDSSIKSESRIIFGLIWSILKTPFYLIMALLRKKSFSDIAGMYREIVKEIFAPKFTTWIIIINVLLFIISLFLPESVIELLLNYPSDIFSARFYTMITSGFLHADLTHLLGNMLAIFIFGRVVEMHLGTKKTSIIYFLSLIISSVFSSVIEFFFLGNNIPGLGASGAIMGLVSTAILLKPFQFVYELLIPLPVFVLGWISIAADITGILTPVEDGIGHFAHLGGFLAIFVMMPFLETEDKAALKKGVLVNLVTLAIAAVVYLFVL